MLLVKIIIKRKKGNTGNRQFTGPICRPPFNCMAFKKRNRGIIPFTSHLLSLLSNFVFDSVFFFSPPNFYNPEKHVFVPKNEFSQKLI